MESLPYKLVEALGEHNSTHPAEDRIRLRMALHAGEAHYDDHGATSVSINLTLLAPERFTSLLTRDGELAVTGMDSARKG